MNKAILTACGALVSAAIQVFTPPSSYENYDFMIGDTGQAVPAAAYHQDDMVRLAAADRKRWMYNACTNTMIIAYTQMNAAQEVPMGPRLG